jgi:D-alanine-D-alanine ligase
MTTTSLLPKIAAGAGYDFGDLCEAILGRARLHLRRPEDAAQPEGSASAPQPGRTPQAAVVEG